MGYHYSTRRARARPSEPLARHFDREKRVYRCQISAQFCRSVTSALPGEFRRNSGLVVLTSSFVVHDPELTRGSNSEPSLSVLLSLRFSERLLAADEPLLIGNIVCNIVGAPADRKFYAIVSNLYTDHHWCIVTRIENEQT